jgi:hypothetical protein
MSMTERETATSARSARDVRDARDDRRVPHRKWHETRLFVRTSEFWAMLVGVAAIVVIYNASSDSSLDLWRACILGVVLAVAYIVSRGFAKSGSQPAEDWTSGYDDRATR